MQLEKGNVVKFCSASSGYLTRGHNYVVTWAWIKNGIMTFGVYDDDGDGICCRYPSCTHGDWELVTNDK